jgi:hypothetical protein
MPNNLVEQVNGHMCSYLARQDEDSRVVVLKETADVSALQPDSIGLVTYNMLEKLGRPLTEAGFTHIIAVLPLPSAPEGRGADGVDAMA